MASRAMAEMLATESMDYDIQRCTKHCSISGRELLPGEQYYSALVADGADLCRVDYATDAWQGPPEKAVGWWKAEIPDPKTNRMHWAPNDVMLQLFDELTEQPDKRDMRYVLSLLLIRRRVMRLEENETDEQGQPVMVVYCPRRDETYTIVSQAPEPAAIETIQEELSQLLK